MSKEIVINAEKEQTRIAILENGTLVELYIENPENERTLGDICLGRVRKIMPSIQAAFVDIGQKQDAFLHFSDLSENLPELLSFVDMSNPDVAKVMEKHKDQPRPQQRRHRPRGQSRGKGRDSSGNGGKGKRTSAEARSKRRHAQQRSKQKSGGGKGSVRRGRGGSRGNDQGPRPETFLKRDQRIPVKIVKEPISNKGSRVSTDISLAGRFLVLVPLADYVAVSKKIHSYKERRRLRALAKSLLPDGFGVIVRTVAQGKNAKTLDTDLRLLIEKWRKMEKNLTGRPNPPKLIHEDVNMVSSVIRDLFSEDYDRILVDDQRVYRNIKGYIQAVAPQMVTAVQAHRGGDHVFHAAGIDREVEEAFQSRINLPSGGYLFIERTEAMHVVDVNSGRSGRGMTQEENSLKVNIESARMIAKQIRLRDLGGIIVVDFIDLRNEKNKKKVYDELKKEFRKDRAVSKILPMSDFGLVQITRQRLRPSITTTFSEPDLGSNGQGKSAPEKPSEPAPPPKPEQKAAPPTGNRRQSGRDGRDDTRRRPRAVAPGELLSEMEQWIVDYKILGNRRAVTLKVHPFLAAFLNRKVPNYPTRWFMKHLIRIRLEADEKITPTHYRFLDARSGEDLTKDIQKSAAQLSRS